MNIGLSWMLVWNDVRRSVQERDVGLPGWRDWAFSIKTFGAAMLAAYVGFWADLPRPYWAMATVYICSQPLSGATRSKAVYRLFGTFIGAIAAVVFVPSLVNAPVLLVGAMGLWTAGCLYFSLLDRTPRAYTFMLAGYTTALIGFPSVSDPGAIFDTAVARVQEIALGIACASLVSSLVLPRPVGEVVAERTNAWLRDTARLSLDVFAARATPGDGRLGTELIRLAGEANETDMLSSQLAYDTSAAREVVRDIQGLRVRMLMLLPALSSIADRLSVLRDAKAALPPAVGDALTLLAAWIRPGRPPSGRADIEREQRDANGIRRAIASAEPPLDERSGWTEIISASLLIRLRELIDIAADCRMLRRAVAAGVSLPSSQLAFGPRLGAAPARHRDHAMALLSAVGVVVAIGLCSALWIGTGWPDGAAAPMMAAVACSFFASRDDPAPAILQFANWTGVAVVIVAAYQFAILPVVNSFEMLALVMAPALILFGVLIARPRTSGAGMALAANGLSALALQSSYNADFPSFANSNIALLLGMYSAAVVVRLMRSVGAEWAVLRLIRAGTATVAQAAARHGRQDRARFAGLMLDRLGLIAPRLAAFPAGEPVPGDLVSDLRIGLNVVDLQQVRESLRPDSRAALDAMLGAVAQRYRADPGASDSRLLACIDEALATVLRLERRPLNREAILGIVGIRRGLFPTAPAYVAARQEQPDAARAA